MTIYLDPAAVKRAAAELRETYTDYDDEETKPDVSVFEKAIERWFEYAINNILRQPDWWAYGPHSHLTTEFEHAMEWALKTPTAPEAPRDASERGLGLSGMVAGAPDRSA